MLQKITLHLARNAEHPEGSARHGYDITAPLDRDGHLDPQVWSEKRDHCRVRRFWAGETDQHGRLVHQAGGAGGATWLIDYDDRSTEDDEPGYRLSTHVFREGEYVSIRDQEGATHTFRIAKVQAA